MAKELIPWKLFLDALQNRPKARLGEWLARFRFTDDGAYVDFDSFGLGKYTQGRIEQPAISLRTYSNVKHHTLH